MQRTPLCVRVSVVEVIAHCVTAPHTDIGKMGLEAVDDNRSACRRYCLGYTIEPTAPILPLLESILAGKLVPLNHKLPSPRQIEL